MTDTNEITVYQPRPMTRAGVRELKGHMWQGRFLPTGKPANEWESFSIGDGVYATRDAALAVTRQYRADRLYRARRDIAKIEALGEIKG